MTHANSFGLVAPDGKVLSHAAAHPRAVFDFLALLGLIKPDKLEAATAQMLQTGWRLAEVEIHARRVLTPEESRLLIAQHADAPEPPEAEAALVIEGAAIVTAADEGHNTHAAEFPPERHMDSGYGDGTRPIKDPRGNAEG